MIYLISSATRDYYLTGPPGLKLQAAFCEFQQSLSDEPSERRTQLLDILEYGSPGAFPDETDLLYQSFLACLSANTDITLEELIAVDLACSESRPLDHQNVA